MSHSTTPEMRALKERLKVINSLRAASSLMYWDQATYLPERAANARGEHLSHLESIAHDLATSSELGGWLDKLNRIEADLDPESDDACLIRVAREDYERNTRIPSEFQARHSAHASRAFESWKKARAQNDFSIVQNDLETMLELSRKLSEHLSTPTRKPGHQAIMDPLIDLTDPGFTVAQLRQLFGTLRQRLIPLLNRVTSSAPFDDTCLKGPYPEASQLAFGEKVVRALGYDFARGRQDKTHHPFMIRLGAHDVRITTRSKEDNLAEALFSSVHEAGHALYELGIDEQLEGTPLASGASSGIHESQSRLWENLVGRSFPFWEHFYPQLQSQFPEHLGSVSLETFHRAINRVERSLIRTDADELSYNLHVMIRFDLECDLLDGRLAVRDLPEAWNARYQSDLGLVPRHLSEGVLQDVHWFHGQIGGMFQGYTIGNVLSGQLYAAARRDLPNLESDIRNGAFLPLREWLRTKLHQHGRKFTGPDLVKRATGRDLAVDDYLSYLETKYDRLMA